MLDLVRPFAIAPSIFSEPPKYLPTSPVPTPPAIDNRASLPVNSPFRLAISEAICVPATVPSPIPPAKPLLAPTALTPLPTRPPTTMLGTDLTKVGIPTEGLLAIPFNASQ